MRKRLTTAERREIHEKTNGHCAYCGCWLRYEDMRIDHVLPLSQGGADEEINMLPACRSCNHYKGGAELEVFRKLVEKMPDTLNRHNATYRNAVRFGLVKPNPHRIVFYFENCGGGMI